MVSDLAFDALADPVRREILAVLAEKEECSAGELSERISRVGRTAVSSHLRVLRTAGLVSERRFGRFRFYSVDPTGPAQDVIRLLQELFQGSLDAAKAAAETRRNDASTPADNFTAVNAPDRRAM
ncbi:ArsR/SmtB family transcription factor [Pseudonocardia sp. H11422]|uniref:ArsR/SmtB family transcription factor n=1 Tax=Pseudonocardia sp. H11422 TaxID=2835866 RepID=UPI001BDCF9EE|nr:metalloregulator ArsR/SmtB family transcription factor [Pseudonocardia sp. H11422]